MEDEEKVRGEENNNRCEFFRTLPCRYFVNTATIKLKGLENHLIMMIETRNLLWEIVETFYDGFLFPI